MDKKVADMMLDRFDYYKSNREDKNDDDVQ